MASIPLPPELKLVTAEFLDPTSSFNFAITCKDHWNLCEPVIQEHSRLFAENRTISTAEGGHFTWDKCKEILKDPRRGWYVRELNLPSNRQTYWDPNVAHAFQATDQTIRPPDEVTDVFARAANEIETRYAGLELDEPPQVDGLERLIVDGADDPIVAILVHHLPHLKTLRFTDLELGALFTLVHKIGMSYGDPALAPSLPFQHLTTVAVAHWDSEMCCDAEWCRYFICVPSLRSFVGLAMGGGIDESADWSKYPKSNVKELLFMSSQFDASALGCIFSGINALERFSYEGGGAMVSMESEFEARKVVQALVDHCAHSLEHLTLEHEDFEHEADEYEPKRVSLRNFQKLKTLKCDWRMIWPDTTEEESDVDELPDGGVYSEASAHASNDFDLGSILPASLETLHLEGDFSDEEWESVAKLVHDSSDLTPKLSRIYMVRRNPNRGWTDEEATEEGAPLPAMRDNPLHALLDGLGY